jgi:hypothetical protein
LRSQARIVFGMKKPPAEILFRGFALANAVFTKRVARA